MDGQQLNKSIKII